MKNSELVSLLASMKGNKYTYRKELVLVVDYSITDSVVRIKTTGNDIVILKEDAELLKTDFFASSASTVAIPNDKDENYYLPQTSSTKNIFSTTVIGKNASVLADLLMDNIRKVKEDKDFIPQALSINDQVKSLIDLAKTEVEMIKAVHVLNR